MKLEPLYRARFTWHGYGHTAAEGVRQLVGATTHFADDERYRWLNEGERA